MSASWMASSAPLPAASQLFEFPRSRLPLVERKFDLSAIRGIPYTGYPRGSSRIIEMLTVNRLSSVSTSHTGAASIRIEYFFADGMSVSRTKSPTRSSFHVTPAEPGAAVENMVTPAPAWVRAVTSSRRL